MFENEETKVNELQFNTKYVSGQALKVITDFKANSYIIKGSTGIGGTTALLNYTNGHCLIISPNVGMIKGKSNGTYKSDKQFFIWSDSQDNWNNVKDSLTISDNVIINTTPDQIIKLRSKDYSLYSLLTQTPIFIDEIHAYTTDTTYRTNLGEFMELVYNEWTASFKLSTATPNYNYIDLPTGNPINIYKVSRTKEPLKPLAVTKKLKDAKRFIKDQINKKRLVICFTNNINYHKSFTSYKVANLVGQNLDTKLKPYKRGLKLDDLLYTNDIIFLSSSYYAGFDIDTDCSICLISEQSNEAYKISPNNIMQAYGRARLSVHDALLVNATCTKDCNGKPIYYPTTLNEVDRLISNANNDVKYWSDKVDNRTFDFEFSSSNEVTTANYVNRAYLMTNTLNLISDYQLYNESVLKSTLEGFNFILTDYVSDKNIVIDPPKHPQFKDRVLNLLELDPKELYYSYIHIKKNLKYKDIGVFSKKLAFEFLTAYLLIKTDAKQIIKMLENKRVKPNEFYNSMDLYLRSNVDTKYYFKQLTPNQLNKLKDYIYAIDTDVINEIKWLSDDWQMLYHIHKVTTNNFDAQIEREILIYQLFYNVDLCKQFNTDKYRVRNTVRAILKQCVELSITLSNNEFIWLKDVLKSIFKALDNGETFTHNNSRKNIKSKMTNALLYLMTDGQITDSKEVKNRVYNPITQLPSNMRCILPIKYVSVDLSSANAQIVDSILKTNMGLLVYQNLMSARGLTRHEAKILYNSTLNNHKLTVSKAKTIYIDCGYSTDKALELARMTAKVKKGSFYEIMTANEKILMQNYSDILPIKSYRFHDALILKLEDIENNHITLPTKVKGYKYHVEIFNDGSNYNGTTTDIKNVGQMINNWFIAS